MYIHFDGSPFFEAIDGDAPVNLPFALRFYGDPGKSAFIFFSLRVLEEGLGKPGFMFLLDFRSLAPLIAPVPAFDAYEGIFVNSCYPVGVPF